MVMTGDGIWASKKYRRCESDNNRVVEYRGGNMGVVVYIMVSKAGRRWGSESPRAQKELTIRPAQRGYGRDDTFEYGSKDLAGT